MASSEVEAILDDYLIEETGGLIERKWLIKWKPNDHNDNNHKRDHYTWEPYESIRDLAVFEQYKEDKRKGIRRYKSPVKIKSFSAEEYAKLIISPDDATYPFDGEWGWYKNEPDDYVGEDLASDEADDEGDDDYGFEDAIQDNIVCLESDDDNVNVHLHDSNDSKSVGNGSGRSTVKHSESIATDTMTTTTTSPDADDYKYSVEKPRKGKWTENEEKRFRQGLELYGRDWKAIAEHIGTRTPILASSHAQGHFLRLLKDGIPLPDKVRESGTGYTLSGKPLNKHSSSVLRVFQSADDVPDVEGVISDEEAANKLKHGKAPKAQKKGGRRRNSKRKRCTETVEVNEDGNVNMEQDADRTESTAVRMVTGCMRIGGNGQSLGAPPRKKKKVQIREDLNVFIPNQRLSSRQRLKVKDPIKPPPPPKPKRPPFPLRAPQRPPQRPAAPPKPPKPSLPPKAILYPSGPIPGDPLPLSVPRPPVVPSKPSAPLIPSAPPIQMTSKPDTEQKLGSDGEDSDSSESLLSASSESSTEMEQKNASKPDTNDMSTALEPLSDVAVRSEDEENEMELSDLIDVESQIDREAQSAPAMPETERVIPNLEKPQNNTLETTKSTTSTSSEIPKASTESNSSTDDTVQTTTTSAESPSSAELNVSTVSNGSNESTVSKTPSTSTATAPITESKSKKPKAPPPPPKPSAPSNTASASTTSTTSTVSTAPSLNALKESIEMLEINNMSNDEQCSVFTTDSICTQDVIDHIEEMEESTPSIPEKAVSKSDEEVVSQPKQTASSPEMPSTNRIPPKEPPSPKKPPSPKEVPSPKETESLRDTASSKESVVPNTDQNVVTPPNDGSSIQKVPIPNGDGSPKEDAPPKEDVPPKENVSPKETASTKVSAHKMSSKTTNSVVHGQLPRKRLRVISRGTAKPRVSPKVVIKSTVAPRLKMRAESRRKAVIKPSPRLLSRSSSKTQIKPLTKSVPKSNVKSPPRPLPKSPPKSPTKPPSKPSPKSSFKFPIKSSPKSPPKSPPKPRTKASAKSPSKSPPKSPGKLSPKSPSKSSSKLLLPKSPRVSSPRKELVKLQTLRKRPKPKPLPKTSGPIDLTQNDDESDHLWSPSPSPDPAAPRPLRLSVIGRIPKSKMPPTTVRNKTEKKDIETAAISNAVSHPLPNGVSNGAHNAMTNGQPNRIRNGIHKSLPNRVQNRVPHEYNPAHNGLSNGVHYEMPAAKSEERKRKIIRRPYAVAKDSDSETAQFVETVMKPIFTEKQPNGHVQPPHFRNYIEYRTFTSVHRSEMISDDQKWNEKQRNDPFRDNHYDQRPPPPPYDPQHRADTVRAGDTGRLPPPYHPQHRAYNSYHRSHRNQQRYFSANRPNARKRTWNQLEYAPNQQHRRQRRVNSDRDRRNYGQRGGGQRGGGLRGEGQRPFNDHHRKNGVKRQRFNRNYERHRNADSEHRKESSSTMGMSKSIRIKSIPPDLTRNDVIKELEQHYGAEVIFCADFTRDLDMMPFMICDRLELKSHAEKVRILDLCRSARLKCNGTMLSATDYDQSRDREVR